MASDVRTCPACSQPIQEGWDTCAACGEPLTVASRVVVDRAGRPMPRWLALSRERAPELKEIGELGSQGRLDSLQRIDDIRESEQQRAARSRARDDRQLLAAAAIAAGIFLLVVLALSLANLL